MDSTSMNGKQMRLLQRIGELEMQAKPVNEKYIKISAEVAKLTQIQSNSEIKYEKNTRRCPYGMPFGVVNLVKSNVTAPLFYYVCKHKVTFGKSVVLDDIVIQSNQCSSNEVTVVFSEKKKLVLWQVTKNNYSKVVIFVNERCLELGEHFNLKSGDKIRFSGEINLNLVYEFVAYSNRTFPTKLDALTYFDSKLNELQEQKTKINRQCNALKTQLENLKKKIKDEPAISQMRKNETKRNHLNKADNRTKVKRDEENFDRSKKIKSEGSKNIGAKLINSSYKTVMVKREKVEASETKIKTESAVQVIEID